MDNYVKGVQLGKGTFGSVYKATRKSDGKVVAIKKIGIGDPKEGVNVTALREIKLLKELKSPRIVELIEVFGRKDKINLVFEYMQSDLEAIIKDRTIVLGPADIKSYMKMILEGLQFCHSHWVLHRDVKPNNMLLAANGELKLADFGLSRIFGSPDRKYTNQVFARWYRPPELLLGCCRYGASIDMWAAGCVFAELLLRRPWFPGASDIDQLGKIYQALGTPTEETWPGCSSLPLFVPFQQVPPMSFRALFPSVSDDALDLLASMVQLDPTKRKSAEQCLQHKYFTNDPKPTAPSQLPKPVSRADAPLQQPPGPAVQIKLKRPTEADPDSDQPAAKAPKLSASGGPRHTGVPGVLGTASPMVPPLQG